MERGGDEDSKREVGDVENDMFKRKMGIDRHSPRLIQNITRLLTRLISHYQLPLTGYRTRNGFDYL
jgi:hypothetical protein